MKNLPQMVDDLRALAAFLMDGASDLEELLKFLGGGAGVPLPHPPAPPPPPPPPPPPTPVHAETEKRPRGRPRRQGGEPRKLTEAEKSAIRADWEALPNHQRSATNRTALSLKHRCSVQQLFALTRSDGHLQKMVKASALLVSQRNQSSSGNAATR